MSFIASTLHPARKSGVEHTTRVYGIADSPLGPERMGAGPLLHRGHPSLPALLAPGACLKPARGTFPNLEAHHDRMMARPAVRKTIAIESAIGYELPAWFPALENPSS